MNKRCLDKRVIDLTSKTKGVGKEYTRAPYRSNLEEVQDGNDMVLLLQESMNNNPSLFNYGLYNNYDNRFDSYLEYGKEYKNKTAFEILSTDEATYIPSLTCSATCMMTHNNSHTMTHMISHNTNRT